MDRRYNAHEVGYRRREGMCQIKNDVRMMAPRKDLIRKKNVHWLVGLLVD